MNAGKLEEVRQELAAAKGEGAWLAGETLERRPEVKSLRQQLELIREVREQDRERETERQRETDIQTERYRVLFRLADPHPT